MPVPDENAFPYGRFRNRNIKNDYAERHVTDGKTKWIYITYIKARMAADNGPGRTARGPRGE